jgi:hypothetical protein
MNRCGPYLSRRAEALPQRGSLPKQAKPEGLLHIEQRALAPRRLHNEEIASSGRTPSSQ